MNALIIERAWKAAMAELYAPLRGTEAASAEVIPNGETIVAFQVAQLERKAGRYWVGQLRIEIDQPARVETDFAAYSAVWTTMLDWLSDEENTGQVPAKFPRDGVSLNGYFLNGSGQKCAIRVG